MTNITKDNIYTGVYSTLYYSISGVVAGSVTNIYSYFPDVGAGDFPGYPICVIDGADSSLNKVTAGSNPLYGFGVNVPVSIYSKSMQTLDQLSDKLISGLNNIERIGLSGITHFSVTASPTRHDTFGQDRVHYKSFGLSFDIYD